MKKIFYIMSLALAFTILISCNQKGGEITTTTTDTPIEKKPISLGNYFQNGMVLQQNKPITVFGTTKENTSLTVEIYNATKEKSIEKKEVSADATGNFTVTFSPVEASYDKYKIVCLNDTTYKEVNEILIGEVWLTSGQSNMRWPIRTTKDKTLYTDRIKNNTYIKFFDQPRYPNDNKASNMSFTPLNQFQNPLWSNLNNYTRAKEASGVAYVFATELFDYLNQNGKQVPVAFIQSAVDASNIHAWLSKETIDHNIGLQYYLTQKNIYISSADEMNKAGNNNYNQMSVLYNHKINPLDKIEVRGVLWYQGANDYTHYTYYENAMTALIAQYREMFGDIPVLAVQQHAFDNATAKDLRLAQSKAMENNTSTAIIPSYDINPEFEYQEGYDMDKISGNTAHHPIQKIEIGKRLFLAATTMVYGNTDNHLSPTFEKYEIKGDQLILTIKNAAEVKISTGTEIVNLNVTTSAGTVPVKAVLEGNKIIIPYTSNITSVEYAFTNLNYGSNLVNQYNVGLIPFKISIKK